MDERTQPPTMEKREERREETASPLLRTMGVCGEQKRRRNLKRRKTTIRNDSGEVREEVDWGRGRGLREGEIS